MTPASGQMNGLFALQYKAVTDFLNAAKSKDKDKLAEVVALRSPQEAATDKNKKLFAAILDQSISDAEVAEISKAFEGFTIMGHNEARSTGKLGIILSKSEQDGGQYRRTIYVRKEAKGWKVVDVSGLGHIEQPVGGIRRPTTARKR